MYSHVIIRNAPVGEADRAAVYNCVAKINNTIHRILEPVDEERLKCLPPVRIEHRRLVRNPDVLLERRNDRGVPGAIDECLEVLEAIEV